MRATIYEIFNARVEVLSMSRAVVTYKVIETGIICKLSVKTWTANAKKEEAQNEQLFGRNPKE